MLLGADRRAAAKFSFWLAMPTMAGAFACDLYKSRAQMSSGNLMLVAVGFIDLLQLRLDRGEDLPRLRRAPRLFALRVVASRGRRRRTARAGAGRIRANTRRFFRHVDLRHASAQVQLSLERIDPMMKVRLRAVPRPEPNNLNRDDRSAETPPRPIFRSRRAHRS
jgi:hypothetical protein